MLGCFTTMFLVPALRNSKGAVVKENQHKTLLGCRLDEMYTIYKAKPLASSTAHGD